MSEKSEKIKARRFPKDCWGSGCLYFRVWDMSIDDLCCHCDILGESCDACEEDFSFSICPKPQENRGDTH